MNQRVRGLIWIAIIVLAYVVVGYKILCQRYGWCRYTVNSSKYLPTGRIDSLLHGCNTQGVVTANSVQQIMPVSTASVPVASNAWLPGVAVAPTTGSSMSLKPAVDPIKSTDGGGLQAFDLNKCSAY